MINPALFIKELVENRIKFWIALVILSGMAIAIPLLFDFTRELERMDLSPLVNPEGLSFILSNYHNYAWSQWTAKNLTQFASLAAIVLGMGALAGETAYGTAPFLLSKPLTRRQVYMTKTGAGIFLLGLIIYISTLVLIAMSVMLGYELHVGPLFTSTVVVFVGASVIYLGTAFISTLIPDPVKAGVVAGLFWALAAVPGFFQATVRYSVYYQMKAIPYWLYGDFPWFGLLVLFGFGYLFFEGGNYYWNRKDF